MHLIKIKMGNGHGCWYNYNLEGDPGRTHVKEDATKYVSKGSARWRIKILKEMYPNREYSLEKV